MFNPFLRRPRKEVYNKEDEQITVSDLVASDTVYIAKCKKCILTVDPPKVTKIVIDDVSESNVFIKAGVVSTFEVVNCNNTIFEVLNENIHTIQIDSSNSITFKIKTEQIPDICFITTHGCQDLKVEVDNSTSKQVYPVTFPSVMGMYFGDALPQYKTTFNANKNDIVSSVVVREGIGHLTTQPEKDAADARQALIEGVVEQVIRNHLNADE
ncbi:cyclase-associated protein 1 [Acrasis kona]|uniref:Cyclase-associated protein 1 n=1 Tax=Acrasis kona TaxID=1008807 RepID=A0AAW2ZL13_9EUKA